MSLNYFKTALAGSSIFLGGLVFFGQPPDLNYNNEDNVSFKIGTKGCKFRYIVCP